MTRYFKYVAMNEGNEDWMYEELQNGRARFGWSGPGSNLRKIKAKDIENRSREEKVIWRYTQFLIQRLELGDRLVVQLERPLRKFLIVEVTGDYKSTDPKQKDFNHYVECRLITDDFINVESKAVSQSLRHHLSKRGQYYLIYDQDAQAELEKISQQAILKDKTFYENNQNDRSTEFEINRMNEDTLQRTYESISQKWPSAYFEKFVADLINSTYGMEVFNQGDTKQGWDLTMRILDPMDHKSLLHDDVPVQCKNYQGDVIGTRPIDDLERCTANSDSPIVYLFILGNLTEQFNKEFNERLEIQKNKRYVEWKIVGQNQIAQMYLNSINFQR
ncbi:hypothetical protein [Alkalicoccus halolimnae]|uniref:Restriction endonuclease n=1 Tax=Alkalicoccus halolimnae TaxID=1667239 RepID=A0A5C7FIQ1_9BACI|nr:hypothetical protein [Alkalicoccus halolimnae]TXF86174.1 hypothetical protein FTX54_06060 [Alkalicoccus halolimnae]